MGAFGGFGGTAAAAPAFGGGGFDFNAFSGKLGALSAEWSPFPVLEQMSVTDAAGMAQSPEVAKGWDWMNPAQGNPGAAGPLDPNKFAPGTPLQGMSPLPMPAAVAAGKAPLSPQQLAALKGMMPQGGQQRPTMPAPSAGLAQRSPQIQFAPVGATPAGRGGKGPTSLGELLALRGGR